MFAFDTCFVFLMDSWLCVVMARKRKIVNVIAPCRGTQDRARQSGERFIVLGERPAGIVVALHFNMQAPQTA